MEIRKSEKNVKIIIYFHFNNKIQKKSILLFVYRNKNTMRLTKVLFDKFSEIPRHYRFIRYGPKKWRDYQARDYEPPYW